VVLNVKLKGKNPTARSRSRRKKQVKRDVTEKEDRTWE
jgi:hypothetical protein